jgi:RNA-directed DNA polymerase
MESQEQIQHEEELWEQIFSRSNLFKALERVRGNKGAPGIDGMTVDELGDHLRAHWEGIRVKLDKGTYVPSPLKRIAIPKANGGERQLGIPTVLDRLIQQSIHQGLTGVFEATFSEHSYGFRPKGNAHQAVEQAQEYQSEGYEWVVDIDLANFFDTVNHDRLMERVKQEVNDSRVLRLINAYLKTGILEDGVVSQSEQGTPQGSPLSPLLSDIVLTRTRPQARRAWTPLRAIRR